MPTPSTPEATSEQPARGTPIELLDGPLPPPPSEPLELTPARRPRSVRRTSSIDMSWPEGPGTPMHMVGRARDIETATDSSVRILAYDTMEAVIGPERTIQAISCDPPRSGITDLVGARGGSGLRGAVDAALPMDRSERTPLALLLDDIAGASLVGGFAWSRHRPNWMAGYGAPKDGRAAAPAIPRRTMVGICAGFRPGSATLNPDGTHKGAGHNVAPVAPLNNPDDEIGWHPLPHFPEVALRRARRMDVWRDGNVFRVDAHFRDSCTDPIDTEVAVHEYTLAAVIDEASLTLIDLSAAPRVLPFAECPAAAPNVPRLIGQPVADLRVSVLKLLTGTDCCTHLNDALRALGDVAELLEAVDRIPA